MKREQEKVTNSFGETTYYRVTLVFDYDTAEVNSKEDAINKAIEELEQTPVGDLYFDVEEVFW